MTQPHARAFDLPGWPCPPRVRDIPAHEGSWGYVMVTPYKIGDIEPPIAIDELGYLWACGDVVPRFQVPSEIDYSPGALLCATPDGLGVWIHPKSLSSLPSVSRLDMQPDQWIPIAVVLAEMPAVAKGSAT